MLKPLLTLALLLPAITHARIGETPEQCVKRYGEVFEKIGTPSQGITIHSKGGVRTHCHFTGDKCISITFELISPVRADFPDTLENRPMIFSAMVLLLLEANKGDSEWVEQEQKDGATYYTSKDGTRRAFSTRTHLIIQTIADVEARKALLQTKELLKTIESF